MSRLLSDWTKRDNFSRSRHQEIVDRLNEMGNLIPVSPGLEVINAPAGRGIRNSRPFAKPLEVLVGWTGNASRPGMYTGRILRLPATTIPTTGTTSLTEDDFGSDPGADDAWVLNLQEIGGTGWLLSEASTVAPSILEGHIIGRQDGKWLIAINSGGGTDQLVRVRLGAVATRPGMYSGLFVSDLTSNFVTSGTSVISEAEFGTQAGNCWIINQREMGKNTWDLDPSGTYLPVIFLGRVIGSDGSVPVVSIDGYQWEDCTQ